MSIVYVQKNDEGEWANPNCFLSAYGFRQKGYEVRPFTSEQLFNRDLPLSSETIVHGGVSQFLEALRQIGVRRPPDPMNYPHPFRVKYMDRNPTEVRLSRIEEELQKPDFRPTFIKPSRTHKTFTGCVIREFSDLLKLGGVPRDTWVFALPEITYLSEYRLFYHHGKLIWSSFYKGDPMVFPSSETVEKISRVAKSLVQVAFSLDIGVAHFPERPSAIQQPTLLVEANDAYALGAYGLPPLYYVNMIEDRWNQIQRITR